MIAVFGAAGFIGAYLVDALKEQSKAVRAIDKYPNIPLGEGLCIGACADITCSDQLERLPWDEITAVVNLASLQPANDDGTATLADYIMVNTIGLCNILDQCRIHGVKRVVHCTSAKPIQFRGEYAKLTISESAVWNITRHYNDQYAMKAVLLTLRPVYGYGPHLEIFRNGKWQKTGFATFIERARMGEPIEVWGNPKASRRIIYVKDAVSAIVHLLDIDTRDFFYDLGGPCISLQGEAETVAKVFARDSIIVYRPDIPNGLDITDIDGLVVNPSAHLWPELEGWQYKYDFEAMCRDFIEEEKRGRYKWLVDKRRKMMEGK